MPPCCTNGIDHAAFSVSSRADAKLTAWRRAIIQDIVAVMGWTVQPASSLPDTQNRNCQTSQNGPSRSAFRKQIDLETAFREG